MWMYNSDELKKAQENVFAYYLKGYKPEKMKKIKHFMEKKSHNTSKESHSW